MRFTIVTFGGVLIIALSMSNFLQCNFLQFPVNLQFSKTSLLTIFNRLLSQEKSAKTAVYSKMAAFDRWKERMEKKIYEIAKIPAIFFKEPNQPQSNFREWKYLFNLKLQAFDVAVMIQHPIQECLLALFRQYDPINAPTPDQLTDMRGYFNQIDIAIQSLLLQSLPNRMIQENDSYIQCVQDRDPLHGVAFALFSRVQTQLSHKVEAEKSELINQLVYCKTPQDEMTTYIGNKQKARAILDERFENPIRDSMQRSFLINGLSRDSTVKTLHEHLLQQNAQSLVDTVTAMEVFARERLCKTASEPKNQVFHTVKHNYTSNQGKNSARSNNSTNSVNNRQSSGSINPASSHSLQTRTICRDFARQGCSRDKCPYSHVPAHLVNNIPCKYANNCNLQQLGKCPFSHSPSANDNKIVPNGKSKALYTNDHVDKTGNSPVVVRASRYDPLSQEEDMPLEDTDF